MEFSNVSSSDLHSNLDRFDNDLRMLSQYTGVNSDDMRVRIAEAKRNLCSLLIEGADDVYVKSAVKTLISLGCKPAVRKLLDTGRF